MSSSVCISSCVNDTRGVPLPTTIIRGTYVNLYRWPESDAEFVRSLSFRSSSSSTDGSHHNDPRRRCLPHPKVVDSISCRQLYLRSYTFTRKESVDEKTKKCIGRVREKVPIMNIYGKSKKKKGKENDERKGGGKIKGKAKEAPCASLKNISTRLLFCFASVDVAS